jgi:hypothetical protein
VTWCRQSLASSERRRWARRLRLVRRDRDILKSKLSKLVEDLRRVRLPEPLLNGAASQFDTAQVPILDFRHSCHFRVPETLEIRVVTFQRVLRVIDIDGVSVSWTTWRPVDGGEQ